MPGGTEPTAPSASTAAAGPGPYGPARSAIAGRAMCASRSKLASVLACQIPFRSGWPSAARGARYVAGACPDNGVAHEATSAPLVAATIAMITPLKVFRTGNSPPAGAHSGRSERECQGFTTGYGRAGQAAGGGWAGGYDRVVSWCLRGPGRLLTLAFALS